MLGAGLGPEDQLLETFGAISAAISGSRRTGLLSRLAPAQSTPSNKASQQTADALQDATQQSEDARQEATYRTAETAKDSHLQLLSRSELLVPKTSHQTPDDESLMNAEGLLALGSETGDEAA